MVPRFVLASIALLAVVGAAAAASLSAPDRNGAGHQTASTYRTSAVSVDVEGYATGKELARAATVVVVGAVSAPRGVRASHDGRFVDYHQTLTVQHVLKGQAAGSIELVRSGLSGRAIAEGVRLEDDAPAGALPAGRYVLLLSPSAEPGVYQVVGHTQGALQFNGARTQTTGHHGLQELNGLDLAEVREIVTAAGQ